MSCHNHLNCECSYKQSTAGLSEDSSYNRSKNHSLEHIICHCLACRKTFPITSKQSKEKICPSCNSKHIIPYNNDTISEGVNWNIYNANF